MFNKRWLDFFLMADGDLDPFIDAPIVPAGGAELPSAGFALIKLFLSLLFVAGLLILTLWFLRRIIRYRLEKGNGLQTIKLLEKKMISPKTMIYFLEIEGEKVILAESQLEVRQLKYPVSTTQSSEHDL